VNEITVIDDNSVSGWVQSVFRIGEIYMTDVDSMVRNVINATQSTLIDRLNIIDHGDRDGIEIGGDWIDDTNLSEYAEKLRRLAGYFAPTGFVHLQHCSVGQNRTLLLALARIWGVSVYAGTGYENANFRFNVGDYVRADPDGTFISNVARP
jgi:hypothetical protein